jgi:hypothetical protein
VCLAGEHVAPPFGEPAEAQRCVRGRAQPRMLVPVGAQHRAPHRSGHERGLLARGDARVLVQRHDVLPSRHDVAVGRAQPHAGTLIAQPPVHRVRIPRQLLPCTRPDCRVHACVHPLGVSPRGLRFFQRRAGVQLASRPYDHPARSCCPFLCISPAPSRRADRQRSLVLSPDSASPDCSERTPGFHAARHSGGRVPARGGARCPFHAWLSGKPLASPLDRL